MYTFVLVIHFIVCLFLILLVLMQNKGSSSGIFGSSNSDSVFAGPSATTFITKLTAGVAVVIMITSIYLTVNVSKRGMSSVTDTADIPAVPAAAASQLPAPSQTPAPAQQPWHK